MGKVGDADWQLLGDDSFSFSPLNKISEVTPLRGFPFSCISVVLYLLFRNQLLDKAIAAYQQISIRYCATPH